MRVALFLIFLSFLVISCDKDKTFTIQEKLDKGTSVEEILEEFPADSLIGKDYRGGWIFHIYSSTNEVLIVSKIDESSSAEWGCTGNDIFGADSLELGYGQINTDEIMAECPNTNTAAGLCYYSSNQGYTDWYLPSGLEMAAIHQNLYLNGFGNFQNTDNFWTSSEKDNDEAYYLIFASGNLDFTAKNNFIKVRAIRKTS